MATIPKSPTTDFVSTSLNGSVNDSTTTIVVNDASALTYPSYAVIDREDANGNATPTLREVVKITNISSNTLTCTRGVSNSTNRSHNDSALFEPMLTVGQWDDMYDAFDEEHGTDGTHDATKVAMLAGTQTFTGNKTFSGTNTFQTGTSTFASGKLAATSPALTTPAITGAMTGTVTPPLTFYASNFNAPQGFLINGLISATVASNDLTVAIKGMDGNDPSATNPVYCRIGNTIRSITAALSVTAADGTNWCGAGDASTATKQMDYFAYLGYNATDGVVIGFSRIPYAKRYADFSATNTNHSFCKISTISNAAATDNYENIGRFAATLSAGAGYTWTVPTFTATTLIQHPIFETSWMEFVPQLSWTATGNPSTNNVIDPFFKLHGSSCTFQLVNSFSSAGTGVTVLAIALPMLPLTANFQSAYGSMNVGDAQAACCSYLDGGTQMKLTIASANINAVFCFSDYQLT